MEIKKITCIICPMGCEIEVVIDRNKIIEVRGAKCRRGVEYAYEEVKNPKRMVISVVKCVDGDLPVVSVKTSKPIPKKYLWNVMKILAKTEVRAPIDVGQIIIPNILNLNVDIVATRPCKRVDSSKNRI